MEMSKNLKEQQPLDLREPVVRVTTATVSSPDPELSEDFIPGNRKFMRHSMCNEALYFDQIQQLKEGILPKYSQDVHLMNI